MHDFQTKFDVFLFEWHPVNKKITTLHHTRSFALLPSIYLDLGDSLIFQCIAKYQENGVPPSDP
ncbi:MAG: hypothetical protein A2156_15845 [Deltaproteobacteria bacterium RBG_16_48_10]|nr:MAG: hypothetical protein A2156_15845 [Deltaproteobacteria bacterium RBG_16_48_10]